ncbi:MAG: Stk1 family PASTA domain-containing Ser/Thr kinase [Gaiellaceae bacterium]
MAVSDTLIDTLFDGRYRIVKKLGAGGMATVYLAEDQELGRRVAIKILNERHANDDQFVERFRREAKNAAGLSHANIVSIFDRGEAEGTYYIAMEHLQGRNLKELIAARGPAPVPIAVEITRHVLAALGHAHKNGIVHRDIKPHNIMVDEDRRVKVTDFGIARAGASQMTEAGSIVGTAQYLSPEQARGSGVDQRSDLYSVGVVLYELLTGKVPFTGESPVEIAMKHLSETPPPPSELKEGLPEELDLVVMRALAKDPARRYQSAAEMDADLARIARGLGVSSETEEAATQIISGVNAMPTQISRAPTIAAPPTYPPAEPVYYDYEDEPRRRSVWPWLAAALIVIGALVGGWYVYDQIQNELDARNPVAVPLLVGQHVNAARAELDSRNLQYEVIEEPSRDQPENYVFDQDPREGTRIDPQTGVVKLWVSTGAPMTVVPDVVGETREVAVARLTGANLEPVVFEINSGAPVGTVTAQEPKGDEEVEEGTEVRINVSKGPKPAAVPSVVSLPFAQAESTLQAAGFQVAREDADSSQPAETVIDQNPAGGESAPRGSTVTLTVSRGPSTSTVPDVGNQDEDTAREIIQEEGFRVRVRREDTEDPCLDGIVLSQDPGGGTEAEPGSTVTIVVGRYRGIDVCG